MYDQRVSNLYYQIGKKGFKEPSIEIKNDWLLLAELQISEL